MNVIASMDATSHAVGLGQGLLPPAWLDQGELARPEPVTQ